ncbi:MAG TPA: glycosyltransferase family 2 protein [Acidimicrobiales bacterium]|nr:glycosyltransferase family 2 protein [Acidimicrobiales bacterium]
MEAGPGVLVVVPAWNEADSVGHVVKETLALVPGVDVLVVDDGSADHTAEVARHAGAGVVRNERNLGVGAAVRVGLRHALAHGYRAAVRLDGDGQHDPADIPLLLAALRDDGHPRLVIGARFAGRGDDRVARPRRVAMAVLAHHLSRVTGTRLTDVTSGFRAHNHAALAVLAGGQPAAYLSDTVEALLVASRAGARVVQVPVGMRPRYAGRPSQSPWRAGAHLARVMGSVALDVARGRPEPAVGA